MNSHFDIASLFAAKSMDHGTLSEEEFHRMISIEQRRAERSGKSFLLMLVRVRDQAFGKNNILVVNKKVLSALSPITRETDVIGWYSEGAIVGLLFTEITQGELSPITAVIMNRVSKELKAHLSAQHFSHVTLSFHLLPEALDRNPSPVATAPMVHPHAVSPSTVTETVLS